MLTRMPNTTDYGVCYDIANTPYTYTFRDWEFHFTRRENLARFSDELEPQMAWLSDSLSKRWKFAVEADEVAVFDLYKKVERRAFYIVDKARGRVIDTPSKVEVVIGVK